MRRNRLQVQPPAGPLTWHRFQELIGLLWHRSPYDRWNQRLCRI